ncbi:DNA-binding transcriptional LysR family regulator [Anaerobacterium chartisolvens]|uniref:DNA-binding transcriptional LysR family regulator n=1 Tax=Anaerobacterium chartisolvens TaxID=1297424 RepID=A0A369ANT1_9FIRM|nr:LysR family transcriptional regulator [Anaerobacterium chartisolvens]RCX09936.1 DNA-binding transcriptional LysR family regulator [Anaerobacterium chartisolvens]
MISKHINMLQIDYFLAVAQYLNFTEAAKSLYISQPSLSKQIAQMEKEIGTQLLLRNKRTVRLTPAGTVLLKELTEIKHKIESAIEKARKPDIGEESSITIGFLEVLNTGTFLPKVINDFKQRYPGVTIVLERHSFKVLREKLINGSLDVIFTLSFEVNDSLGILYDTVYETWGSIVMSASHPLANCEELSLSDLKDEKFVMISRDESPKGFDSIIGLCRKYGFTPNIVKQLPNAESLLMCIESGLGISLLDYNVRIHNSDRFKMFKIEEDLMNVIMAWKKDNLNPSISLLTTSVLKETRIEETYS